MMLAIILLIVGIILLKAIDGGIGFVLGAGIIIIAFALALNTAIVTPENIPHKDKIAEVSKKTKTIVKHVKDKIEEETSETTKPEPKVEEKEWE